MKLYVIRHATAKDVGEDNILTDEARSLTQTGEREAETLGAYLKSKSVQLDMLVHSPLLRTTQTAQLIAKHLTCPLKASEKLSTEHGLKSYIDVIDEHKFVANLGIVAHQPTLSKLVLTLMGADQRAGMRFDKGAMAVMQLERLSSTWSAQLVSLIAPSDIYSPT
jgi:phosphohistidine phosphatase